MPRPSRAAEIDAALRRNVSLHPRDLVRVVGESVGVSRAAVAARARTLIDAGFLEKSGTTRPIYRIGPLRRNAFEYALAGLSEDEVWSRDVAPLFAGLPRAVIDICQYGLTEIVNNAVDHSEGLTLAVEIERDTDRVTIFIGDDGVGIFLKIARALDLPDERLALLELSKGKLTTDPARHSGEGVFFTSRVFDAFSIASGGLMFDHDAFADIDFIDEIGAAPLPTGTVVSMQLAVSSERTLKQVFDQFSSGPDEYAFAKTIVPVRLAKIGDENLVSRSQAKRLMRRVDRFRKVVLDFEAITNIGQAFADEVFRVFANAHPAVELIATHAAPQVQQMIRRAEVARDEGRQLSAD